MMYKVFLSKKAEKQFAKIDRYNQKIIANWIDKNLNNTDDPRRYGKALVGNLRGFWRYRVGDYRIIAEINDNDIVIYLLEIGHRKEIYEQ